MPRAVAPRKKRTPKTATAGFFYVAPTTPFVPKSRPAFCFSIKTAPSIPSQHVVDLRNITPARPHGTKKSISKKEGINFSNVTIARTLSEHPDQKSIWNQLALVAFGRFIFAVLQGIIFGIGKLVIAPISIGMALYDKFDPDRAVSIEPKVQTVLPETEPVVEEVKVFAPKTESKYEELPRSKRHFKLRRALISFAGTSLAIILPLQGLNTFHAYQEIKSQAQEARSTSLSALNGTSTFSEAQAAIGATRESVEGLGKVANTLLEHIPQLGSEFRSGKALLKAGDNLSTAATLLTRSLDFLNDNSLDLTEKLAKAQELAERAEPLLSEATISLNEANKLPASIQGDIDSLRIQVNSVTSLVKSFVKIAPSLRTILGEKEARRYLVLFQNNAELRPTGGFVGSFALVDVDRGAVKRVEVPAGGPYDLQGSLKTSVLAPEPIRLISAKWEFQDANWFPDFPTSAKKLTWFYNQSGGPTVDGVISINAPVLARLLDTVGPISMPAYKTIATGTTVLATAQEIVESTEARASGKPKQFIADLLPLVLAKITSAQSDNALATIKVFSQALEEKDIQMSFNDPVAQESFDGFGWTGKLNKIPNSFDSLGLVRTNIAGGKTDTVIKTSIRHQGVILEDGTIKNHVEITLEHQGKKGDKFTGVRNVEYLRLYVPEGSRLQSASGDIREPAYTFFDIPPAGCVPDNDLTKISGVTLHDPNTGVAINNEFGRTVFGAWTQTDPGSKSTLIFDYELPFKVTLEAQDLTTLQKIGISAPSAPSTAFGLMIEKQSGAINTEINSTLKLPASWYPALSAPEGIAQTDGWSYTTDLKTNKAIGIIIAK